MAETGGRIGGGSFRPLEIDLKQLSDNRRLPSNAQEIYPLREKVFFSLTNGEEEIDVLLTTESFHWYSIPTQEDRYTLEIRGLFHCSLDLFKRGFIVQDSLSGCFFEDPSSFLFLVERSEFIYPKENGNRVISLLHARTSCAFSKEDLILHFIDENYRKVQIKPKQKQALAATFQLETAQKTFNIPLDSISFNSEEEEWVQIRDSSNQISCLPMIRNSVSFVLTVSETEFISLCKARDASIMQAIKGSSLLPTLVFGDFVVKRAAIMSCNPIDKGLPSISRDGEVKITIESQTLV